MLKENTALSGQDRRWFSDDYFDLIVWYDEVGKPTGFQLCYDKEGGERALTWLRDGGISHNRIDAGEDSPYKNMSPVLVPDGVIPYMMLRNEFSLRGAGIDPAVYRLVAERLTAADANA